MSPEVLAKTKGEDENSQKKANDLYSNVKGAIADKMLQDSRQEEQKEAKSRFTGKGQMEDIKEQDSELENASQHKNTPAAVEVKPALDTVNIQAKIKELTAKKAQLEGQLTRFKDS